MGYLSQGLILGWLFSILCLPAQAHWVSVSSVKSKKKGAEYIIEERFGQLKQHRVYGYGRKGYSVRNLDYNSDGRVEERKIQIGKSFVVASMPYRGHFMWLEVRSLQKRSVLESKYVFHLDSKSYVLFSKKRRRYKTYYDETCDTSSRLKRFSEDIFNVEEAALATSIIQSGLIDSSCEAPKDKYIANGMAAIIKSPTMDKENSASPLQCLNMLQLPGLAFDIRMELAVLLGESHKTSNGARRAVVSCSDEQERTAMCKEGDRFGVTLKSTDFKGSESDKVRYFGSKVFHELLHFEGQDEVGGLDEELVKGIENCCDGVRTPEEAKRDRTCLGAAKQIGEKKKSEWEEKADQIARANLLEGYFGVFIISNSYGSGYFTESLVRLIEWFASCQVVNDCRGEDMQKKLMKETEDCLIMSSSKEPERDCNRYSKAMLSFFKTNSERKIDCGKLGKVSRIECYAKDGEFVTKYLKDKSLSDDTIIGPSAIEKDLDAANQGAQQRAADEPELSSTSVGLASRTPDTTESVSGYQQIPADQRASDRRPTTDNRQQTGYRKNSQPPDSQQETVTSGGSQTPDTNPYDVKNKMKLSLKDSPSSGQKLSWKEAAKELETVADRAPSSSSSSSSSVRSKTNGKRESAARKPTPPGSEENGVLSNIFRPIFDGDSPMDTTSGSSFLKSDFVVKFTKEVRDLFKTGLGNGSKPDGDSQSLTASSQLPISSEDPLHNPGKTAVRRKGAQIDGGQGRSTNNVNVSGGGFGEKNPSGDPGAPSEKRSDSDDDEEYYEKVIRQLMRSYSLALEAIQKERFKGIARRFQLQVKDCDNLTWGYNGSSPRRKFVCKENDGERSFFEVGPNE